MDASGAERAGVAALPSRSSIVKSWFSHAGRCMEKVLFGDEDEMRTSNVGPTVPAEKQAKAAEEKDWVLVASP
eukprot:scaffold501_cov355-Pinguiococcus_pyrenoidosus.AAC.22